MGEHEVSSVYGKYLCIISTYVDRAIKKLCSLFQHSSQQTNHFQISLSQIQNHLCIDSTKDYVIE